MQSFSGAVLKSFMNTKEKQKQQEVKKEVDRIHFMNWFCAEASKGVGRDSLYVDVVLEVTIKNKRHKIKTYFF